MPTKVYRAKPAKRRKTNRLNGAGHPKARPTGASVAFGSLAGPDKSRSISFARARATATKAVARHAATEGLDA